MNIEEIIEINAEALLCDGFDGAIIGMAKRIGLGPVVEYDIEEMIQIMIKRDGMSYE